MILLMIKKMMIRIIKNQNDELELILQTLEKMKKDIQNLKNKKQD